MRAASHGLSSALEAALSLYESLILPCCIHFVCGNQRFDDERAALCGGLTGRVLELGFGSGTNLPFYGPGVRELVAVEPSGAARALSKLGRERFAGALSFASLVSGRIQLPDASVDEAVCSFTLCTVPDVAGSLAELKRVLRPGGRLHVLEHGLAPDAKVARLQRTLDPAWSRLAGGCHLTRDVLSDLGSAGFVVGERTQGYAPDVPRTHGYLTRAVAAL
jgi:SAM-dependent methyltransferase